MSPCPLLILLTLNCFINANGLSCIDGTRADDFVDRIISRLLGYQFNQTQEYIEGPLNLPQQQFVLGGLFPTTFYINAIGNLSFIRDTTIIQDANFFTTSWVLEFFYELKELNVVTSFDKNIIKSVQNAIPALHMFQNKNFDENDLSISFWLQYKQTPINSTIKTCKSIGLENGLLCGCRHSCFGRNCKNVTSYGIMGSFCENIGKCCCGGNNYCKYPMLLEPGDVYCASSENLLNPLKTMTNSDVESIEFMLGLSHEDLRKILHDEYLNEIRRNLFSDLGGIPSDFDDSSVALALTTQFIQHPEYFGADTASLWLQKKWTKNIQFFTKSLARNAYRPLSNNKNVNIIDPRIYYWIRWFIEENKDDRNISFIATWEMTMDEIIYSKQNNFCYQTPLFLNNIDISVGANVIYALTRSLFTTFSDDVDDQSMNWFNEDIQRIYHNTTNLILYAIQDNLINLRPEIVFLYYPSISTFYWFISRTLLVYREIEADNKYKWIFKDYPFIKHLYKKMEEIMEHYATIQILSSVQTELRYNNKYYFWDSWIGNDDETPHFYDRIFNTAMYSNALLNIWTDYNLKWKPATPDNVKLILKGSILFLRLESFNLNKYRLDNSFFSVSVKTVPNTLIFPYPINLFQFITNGTIIDPVYDENCLLIYKPDDTIYGVEGYIEIATYREMMNKKPCSFNTPTKFNTFNQYNKPWPYWSAHSITDSSILLAVTKYDAIIRV